jgi:hypothetical protein
MPQGQEDREWSKGDQTSLHRCSWNGGYCHGDWYNLKSPGNPRLGTFTWRKKGRTHLFTSPILFHQRLVAVSCPGCTGIPQRHLSRRRDGQLNPDRGAISLCYLELCLCPCNSSNWGMEGRRVSQRLCLRGLWYRVHVTWFPTSDFLTSTCSASFTTGENSEYRHLDSRTI